jgi:hypothetical protein
VNTTYASDLARINREQRALCPRQWSALFNEIGDEKLSRGALIFAAMTQFAGPAPEEYPALLWSHDYKSIREIGPDGRVLRRFRLCGFVKSGQATTARQR